MVPPNPPQSGFAAIWQNGGCSTQAPTGLWDGPFVVVAGGFMLEVEMKFRVDDVAALRALLAHMTLERLPTENHVDTYFRHPVRDFAKTDEAFRCRIVDDRAWLTYKGPRLDATTKSREELELPLEDASAARTFKQVAERLGSFPSEKCEKLAKCGN